MDRIGIYGVGGFGREVLPLVRAQYAEVDNSSLIQFIDDNPTKSGVNGHDVLKYDDWLSQSSQNKSIVICVADGFKRERIFDKCSAHGVCFPLVRADNAVVFDAVKIGLGAILSSFVHITSNVEIGKCFHANIYSYVAHDCVIGDFVTFAPRVMCNGNVIIEDHAYIGTGAIIKQGEPGNPLVIGAGSVVGMGAVVTKNVPRGTVVVGNPARPKIMKQKEVSDE